MIWVFEPQGRQLSLDLLHHSPPSACFINPHSRPFSSFLTPRHLLTLQYPVRPWLSRAQTDLFLWPARLLLSCLSSQYHTAKRRPAEVFVSFTSTFPQLFNTTHTRKRAYRLANIQYTNLSLFLSFWPRAIWAASRPSSQIPSIVLVPPGRTSSQVSTTRSTLAANSGVRIYCTSKLSPSSLQRRPAYSQLRVLGHARATRSWRGVNIKIHANMSSLRPLSPNSPSPTLPAQHTSGPSRPLRTIDSREGVCRRSHQLHPC